MGHSGNASNESATTTAQQQPPTVPSFSNYDHLDNYSPPGSTTNPAGTEQNGQPENRNELAAFNNTADEDKSKTKSTATKTPSCCHVM